MHTEDTSIRNTAFIGVCAGAPVPLPFEELVAHHESIRDAIAEALHVEHLLEPDLKSLVAIQSTIYAFNIYKAFAHLMPELFHETGSVVLRQLWEVSLNLHWIEGDPDVRSQAFCSFTLMEQRKNFIKSGQNDQLREFDAATATYQAGFRFVDRKGNEQVYKDFAAKNVSDRAREVGGPWNREYDTIYYLTSLHAHGGPGAIFQGFFTRQYPMPEVRERNSMALLIILSVKVMVRNIQLLNRLGILSNESVASVKKAFEAFQNTMEKQVQAGEGHGEELPAASG
ncbi:MAG: DUF5677 domain-containing protein [Fimbriiglobus sp.]